jgi:hypothetical protein
MVATKFLGEVEATPESLWFALQSSARAEEVLATLGVLVPALESPKPGSSGDPG